MRWNFVSIVAIGALCSNAVGQSIAQTTPPPATNYSILSDDEIRGILADRIDNQRQGLGIVVGVIEPKGRRVIVYGGSDRADKSPLTGDTVFPIGGITTVFTGLLLADMVQHRQIGLADPIVKYLPKTVKLSEQNQQITLESLATHTSGFPLNPDNVRPKDPTNPYVDYTVSQFHDFLASYRPTSKSGSEADYSNVGYGLLGQILSLRAGMSYDALVRSRITGPLGMKSTGITLAPAIANRRAVGHDSKLNPAPDWEGQVLAGAGGLRSTANDLLTLLAAQMGYTKSPLAPAMDAMFKVRPPAPVHKLENVLGWQVLTFKEHEIAEKEGASYSGGGYSTFIAYDTKARVGVVVLSNTSTSAGIGDIALHLLDPSYPLRGRRQKEVTVNPSLFDGYAGRYQLSPSVVITISRQGDHLFAQKNSMPKFEVFPESDRTYFYKTFDAQLSFDTDSEGRATQVAECYGGTCNWAKRIETPAGPAQAK